MFTFDASLATSHSRTSDVHRSRIMSFCDYKLLSMGWQYQLLCGWVTARLKLPSAMIKIKFNCLHLVTNIILWNWRMLYLTITRDKSFIIPFSLTREKTKCTLLMPQVFTQVWIKALLTLIGLTNMGWKFFSVWYHRRASMTTLSALRYNWRFKLRKIIPTSRPRLCLLHWVACLSSYRLDDIPC